MSSPDLEDIESLMDDTRFNQYVEQFKKEIEQNTILKAVRNFKLANK